MVNMDNFTNTKIYYDEKNKIIYDENFNKTDYYYINFFLKSKALITDQTLPYNKKINLLNHFKQN
jgi:hypothetical protein